MRRKEWTNPGDNPGFILDEKIINFVCTNNFVHLILEQYTETKAQYTAAASYLEF